MLGRRADSWSVWLKVEGVLLIDAFRVETCFDGWVLAKMKQISFRDGYGYDFIYTSAIIDSFYRSDSLSIPFSIPGQLTVWKKKLSSTGFQLQQKSFIISESEHSVETAETGMCDGKGKLAVAWELAVATG